MSFKVTGGPASGKIKSHIEVKTKVSATTGKNEQVIVETPVKKEKEHQDED